MKILISISDLSIGGAQIFAVRLANALSINHSIYIYNYELLQKHRESALLQKLPPNAKVIYMPPLFSWLSMKLDKILCKIKLKPVAFNYVKKLHFKILTLFVYRIDIINTHLYHSDSFVVSALKNSKIPVVTSDHGDYRFVIERGISTLNEIKDIVNRVNGIIYPSHSNTQFICRYMDLYKALEKTIYYGFLDEKSNGYTESARKKLGISEKAFVFGMVARGVSEKGWAEAIQAIDYVRSLSTKEVHLILVGESDYLSSLKNFLKPELNSFVHFVGHSSEPNYWIESFDVAVLPTYFSGESLPNSIIEYLSLAKPVIATEVGGIPEMLNHNGKIAGFIIHLTQDGKADITSMADAMLSYVNQPDLLEKHSHIAKEASEKFQMQTCLEAYESFFQQILKKAS